jgi:hypothetical protein
MANADEIETTGWAERVERLVRLVPGLGKYQDREGLRETDKRVRMYLAELLGNLTRPLEAAQRHLVDGKWLDRLATLDRIGRQMRTLADRVRFASYGFAGVFAAHKIRQPELTALHAFDVKLLEEIPRLQTCLQALADHAAEPTGFAEAAQAAEDECGRFERALDERDRLARGL